MADINLMNLYQDEFQDIQDFRDQYVAMRKVCLELDLHFGRSENHMRDLLKKIGKLHQSTSRRQWTE